MKLTSPAFENQGFIPRIYTCDGPNVSPPLVIEDISPFAKSLTLIMDDPDAPSGTFTHWTVWNLPPTHMILEEGILPLEAIEGITDFHEPGFNGPCPPLGTGVHHYRIKLYALNTTLTLHPTSTVDALEVTISDHILETCILVVLYTRDDPTTSYM